MGMILEIYINDKELIEDLKAVGSADLKNHFLPKAGIKADSVTFYTVEPPKDNNNENK